MKNVKEFLRRWQCDELDKLKRYLIIPLLLFICNVTDIDAQIRYIEKNREWVLETNAMTYKLGIIDDQVFSLYYGSKIADTLIIPWVKRKEVAVRGGIVNKTPAIEVIFNDGTRDLDLRFLRSEILSDGEEQILRIDQKDSFYPIIVSSFYKIFPDHDIIERWTEIKNIGQEDILVEKAMSASLWLPANNYEMTQFSGFWGNEFQPNTSLLTQGRKIVESRNFKSYGSPLFMVNEANTINESSGDIWYGQIHYSGNWALEFDKQAKGELQILGGINFWDTKWTLKHDLTFKTPIFSFGYTNEGIGQVSRNYSSYIRERILPKQRRNKTRPVLYNSWYATEFDVNEEQQLELAKIAKKIGVEIFVIDDGWFKGRVNSKGGLGDWTVDTDKFPNGLNPLIDKINKLGMDFGLWVEPEMVNPNSDLYRTHPDWVLHFKNRERTTGRNQLMLNLAREDVYQYLYKSLHSILTKHNIKYLKWDMNKELTEPGWPDESLAIQHEVRIRYIDNLYRLIDSIRKEFPNLWIEDCSSGGGRVDLGMLSRMDIAWASDNIDPVDRIYIQYAYLNSFPANTMVSWTGNVDHHNLNYSLDFRFDVAMSGVLGVGHDITKWNSEDVKVATEKIKFYKQIREITHNGILFRLKPPFDSNKSILQYINPEKTESVIFCYQLEDPLRGSSTYPFRNDVIILRGLNPDKTYLLQGSGKKYSGRDLMDQGFTFPLDMPYSSTILKFTAE